MKSKILKIMGVVLALVLISSMMVFALPTSADPYKPLVPMANMWVGFTPTAGILGAYFYDGAITKVGPIDEAINGDLYAYVANATGGAATHDIFKSTDGGRTWMYSKLPGKYAGGAVVEIVCSDLSEDVVYVTDGNYVYKSLDSGQNFAILGENSLETVLWGACGPAVTINWTPITCMDVTYDGNGNAFVFIGVSSTYSGDGTPDPTGQPSVLYINEGGFPASWTDLTLHCFHEPAGGWGAADAGDDIGYEPYSIGCSPDFATSKKVYVVVSNEDDNDDGTLDDARTYVVSTIGVVCDWTVVAELLWDCLAANNFEIRWASRFAFPDDFATTKTMFIGVAGLED